MELYKAHAQWANRPADERFNSLEALHDATKHYRDNSVERPNVPYSTLRAEANGGDVVLVGKGNVPATLTNWAFGQLSARAGAPASYLRTLPATLACQNINHGLKALKGEDDANLLFHSNGSYVCRSVTSDRYERIWNHEVAQRVVGMQEFGWEAARPDIRLTGNDAPALYASDHDMFAMIRLRNRDIQQPVVGAKDMPPMYKGLIYENSEVGASSIKVTGFYYNAMCGNHIIWGASGVVEYSAKHVGSVNERVQLWNTQLRRFADASTAQDEALMRMAAITRIAATKDELLDSLFQKRALNLSRKVISAAYEAVIPEQDGDPLTKWGFVQGLTRHSQTVKFADQRNVVDRAAGKILAMAF